MKFHLEGPSQIEASKIEVKDNTVIATPVTVKGQHIIRAGYITAKGDGGTESKAVVLFNANTGEFSLQKLNEEVKFDFDKPKNEFEEKRASARSSGKKGQQKRQSNQSAPAQPPQQGGQSGQ